MAKDEKKSLHRMEGVQIDDYKTFLKENSRPPSRGGNTSALHVHTMFIGEERYSFFARGSKRWIFKGDLVSFDYEVTPEGYRNVVRDSIVTVDQKGQVQLRGDRRWKPKLRTAETRMPGSRRERMS
jgi:hypothetical protein